MDALFGVTKTTRSLPAVVAPPGAPTSLLVADNPASVSRPLRILLAEDEEVSQELLGCVLKGRGHEVTIADNGHEAVIAVQRQPFDLVLMDVQMPEMDGYEATATIRAWEAVTGRRLPIIAMTAAAQPGDRARCLAAGMSEYVTKPVRPSDLFETIARCLEKTSLSDTQVELVGEGAES